MIIQMILWIPLTVAGYAAFSAMGVLPLLLANGPGRGEDGHLKG